MSAMNPALRDADTGNMWHLGSCSDRWRSVRTRALLAIAVTIALSVASGPATAQGTHSSFPTTDGPVWALAISGRTLYVGGDFTHVDGLPRSGLAAIDLTTETVTPWNPTADGTVRSLVPAGGSVYVSGSFNHVAGQVRYLAALIDSSTGAALDWNPIRVPSFSDYCALAASPTSSFVAYFNDNWSHQPGYQLKAFDTVTGDSLLWEQYLSQQGAAEVHALVLLGGHLFVAGRLDSLGLTSFTGGLAMLDPATGAVQSYYSVDAYPFSTECLSLAEHGGTLYVGGDHALGAVDATTGDVLPWAQTITGFEPQTWAMVTMGDRVYVGGSFSAVGGHTRQNLAALDGGTAALLGWAPATDDKVFSLAAANGVVYVAGNFQTVNGEPHAYLAAVDDSTHLLDVVADRIPEEQFLAAPLPNPVVNSCRIRFDLPRPADVTLDVLDVAGRHVSQLLSARAMSAGHHDVLMRRNGLAAGMYWIRLTTGNGTSVRPVVLVP